MLIRRSVDTDGPAQSPIPTQVVSNGEYYPFPKTPLQCQVDERLTDYADHFRKPMGISRRAFLRTACGMATVMLAMNDVFARLGGRRGPRFFPNVTAAGAGGLACARALLDASSDFIFDVQTHHVDVDGAWKTRNPLAARFFSCLRSPACDETSFQLLSRQNFIKEVFLDSATSMAIISGVPTRDVRDNALPPAQMAATRDLVNEMAGAQRMLAHGLVRPNLGYRLHYIDMARQARLLKVAAWKASTGATLGHRGWWLDDEVLAYRMYEHSLRLGIHNFCVHKGLPLGIFDDNYLHPRDVAKAARDWPAMNFIIYHSSYPYVDDFVAQKALAPESTNIYCELGS